MITAKQLNRIIFENQHELRNSMVTLTDYQSAAKELNKEIKSKIIEAIKNAPHEVDDDGGWIMYSQGDLLSAIDKVI